MQHIQPATAVYADGVLKLLTPIDGLTNGGRVEVALVRVVPIDQHAPAEVARRERMAKEHQERMAALPPDSDELGYQEECKQFDEHRNSTRKLFPPKMKGITW
jgi:predicted DNA-binding antitoxin AbrB/MazE fold protein